MTCIGSATLPGALASLPQVSTLFASTNLEGTESKSDFREMLHAPSRNMYLLARPDYSRGIQNEDRGSLPNSLV